MDNLTRLLGSTEKALGEVEKNLKKIQKGGKFLKEKAQPAMAKYEEVKKEFIEWKRDLLLALIATMPHGYILCADTPQGHCRVCGRDYIVFQWDDKKGHHDVRWSAANLIEWGHLHLHFLSVCSAIIDRMHEAPHQLNKNVQLALRLIQRAKMFTKKR